MISLDDLTELIASTLMPGGPELVMSAARDVATAILAEHAVLALPESSHVDENGTSWNADDGYTYATASDSSVLCGDDWMNPDEAERWGLGLVAAAAHARKVGAHR